MKFSSFTYYFFVMAMSVALSLFSCGAGNEAKPKDLIEKDKFSDVLMDVRLLEGAYATRVGRPDTIKQHMEEYYQFLFTKHGITKDQFYSTYEYYMSQHQEMLDIEDVVMEKLALYEAGLNKRIPPETIAEDTIKAKLNADSLAGKNVMSRPQQLRPK